MVLCVTLLPIFSILFSRVRLNGEKWFNFFLLIFLLSLIATVIPGWSLTEFGVTKNLFLYVNFAFLNFGLISDKFKKMDSSKVFACTLLIVFIMAEYWEIPIYIYGYLGTFNGLYKCYVPFGWFIHHIYVFAVFLLYRKMSNFKFTKLNIAIFETGIVAGLILVAPQFRNLIPFFSVTVRITSFMCFTVFMYLGVQTFKPLSLRKVRLGTEATTFPKDHTK